MTKLYSICLGLFVLAVTYTSAQSIERQAFVSTGASDATASYTIGEVVVSDATTVGSAFLIAGFQQPLLEGTDTPTLGVIDISRNLSVYPNPSSDFVNISGEVIDFAKAKVSLFTLEGKQIPLKVEVNDRIKMDIRSLPQNIYWLYVEFPASQKMASFKLIKN